MSKETEGIEVKELLTEIRHDFHAIRTSNMDILREIRKKESQTEVVAKELSDYRDLIVKIEHHMGSMDRTLHNMALVLDSWWASVGHTIPKAIKED